MGYYKPNYLQMIINVFVRSGARTVFYALLRLVTGK